MRPDAFFLLAMCSLILSVRNYPPTRLHLVNISTLKFVLKHLLLLFFLNIKNVRF